MLETTILILIFFILIIFFAISINSSNNHNVNQSNLLPIELKDGEFMLVEPLIVSTPDPSVLLSARHGFVHAHRLDAKAAADVPSIRNKFSKTAIENGSIYYVMGVGEYNPSHPEFPVDPRSFASANIRNPTEGSFKGHSTTEIAEILTYDGKAPSHIQTPHDFIHLNYIGERNGKHLYYVLGAAKFKPTLVNQ